MLGWLRTFLFGRPRLAVFRFRDQSGRWQYRDPSLVRRELHALRPDWMDLVGTLANARLHLPPGTPPEVVRARAEAADAACRELASLVSQAFGVGGVDDRGGGWTEAERVDLLADYLGYCSDLREKHRPLADSPAATASPPG